MPALIATRCLSQGFLLSSNHIPRVPSSRSRPRISPESTANASAILCCALSSLARLDLPSVPVQIFYKRLVEDRRHRVKISLPLALSLAHARSDAESHESL